MLSKKLIKFYLLIIILLGSFSHSNAQEEPVVKWKGGKKYIVHTIKKGDTWSALSVKYKAPMKDLQAINPNSKVLKFDQSILIPYENYILSKKAVTINSQSKSWEVVKYNTAEPIQKSPSSAVVNYTTYKVQAGETLYRISKKYNMNYNDLAKFNGLTSTNVQAGQVIKIPNKSNQNSSDLKVETKSESKEDTKLEEKPVLKEEPKQESKLVQKADSIPLVNNNKESSTDHTNPYTYQETNGNVRELGVATWLMESTGGKKEKFYALHRTAAIGTIIKVINPMTNRSVFVKVVGVLPDTGDNHDVLIKITQSAARRIGVIDSRFRVEINYKLKE